MLGLWTRNFQRFLNALDGTDCPLCAVIDEAVRNQLGKVARHPWLRRRSLCATHLRLLLEFTPDAAARVSAVQDALQRSLAAPSEPAIYGCELCALSQRLMYRLARMIGAMEGRIRFEKALENGPLVCAPHTRYVLGTARAERFGQIQQKKVDALSAEIAQSRLRHSGHLEELMASAVRYLGEPERERRALTDPSSRGADIEQLAAAARSEFAGWDETKRLAHVTSIESELASLRYRNWVLAEENRRLKLAHTASEAARHDLERDRRELLVAVEGRGPAQSQEKPTPQGNS